MSKQKKRKFNKEIWGDVSVFVEHWNRVANLQHIRLAEYSHDITPLQWCSLAAIHGGMLLSGPAGVNEMIRKNGGCADDDQINIFDLL